MASTLQALPMRILAALAALVLVASIAAACGAGGEEPQVTLRLLTPTATIEGTPLPPGQAALTPTPIPPPELLLSTDEVFQAGTVLASLTGSVSAGKITFLGRSYTLTKGARSMYAFLGVGTEDPVGETQVKVDFTLTNGTRGTLSSPVTVLKTAWTVDALTFTDTQTSQLLDPKVVESENRLLEQMYRTMTPEKLWDSAWQMPANAVLTARFGEQRSVNGGPPSGHHGGTDLGANEGTPVYATNKGKVIMARQLNLRGNMIIIDHGGGVLSGYGHMADFAVAEGKVVEAGELIGHVGNTGLSTGPHLHWEISIAGILVDALRFVDGTNGF